MSEEDAKKLRDLLIHEPEIAEWLDDGLSIAPSVSTPLAACDSGDVETEHR